jgi:hypothetical protein
VNWSALFWALAFSGLSATSFVFHSPGVGILSGFLAVLAALEAVE